MENKALGIINDNQFNNNEKDLMSTDTTQFGRKVKFFGNNSNTYIHQDDLNWERNNPIQQIQQKQLS